ncbi:MAG TPA: ATP-binding protein, partial [Lachnospiraceae bacterium]
GSISIFYEKDRHCLTIKDTGIGIAKWDLPKIFNRGYSGFNGSLNEKSSGIGLFLAKKIADRLHYKLEVESVLGQGTSFRICISDEN